MIFKDDKYIFRLSILNYLQVVTFGYFNIKLTLLLGIRSRLHTL